MSSEFPLDSFRDAAPYLRRPFTSAAVKFKVQAIWPKQNPSGGLIVAYIDARLAVERLNLIVPHLWHDEYQPDGKYLMCRLTVDGISRHDIGEGVGKGLYSDALKRAAVKFGVGVSLYAIPKMMLNVSDGHLKPAKDSLALTPAGEARVRDIYARWLQSHGVQAFGEALDHGDAEDAQGDPEEPAVTPVDDPAVSPDQLRTILMTADESGVGSAVLANIIKVAQGAEPTLFETEDQAARWVDRWLPDMPARFADSVLTNINAEGKPRTTA